MIFGRKTGKHEALVAMVEARLGEDPEAPASDRLDPSYFDADEGTVDGEPITSLGGSERVIWLWIRRHRGLPEEAPE